jgi:hypothetical protein
MKIVEGRSIGDGWQSMVNGRKKPGQAVAWKKQEAGIC